MINRKVKGSTDAEMKIKRTGDVEQERLKNSDKGLKKKVN
jgi:hypothetical protein